MAYSEGGFESDIQSAESTSSSGSETPGDMSSTGDQEMVKLGESSSGSGGPGTWRDDRPVHFTSTSDDTDDTYWRSNASPGPYWALKRFFRRLFGFKDDAHPGGLSAGQLARLAREGHDLHPHYCNQSVAHVTERLGIDGLDGKQAGEQVAYMRLNWGTVGARAAQDRANAGALVVAGLDGPGQVHTAIVTPGPGTTTPDGEFYPNVTCGGPLNARSDGSRTAADVWPPSDRGRVQYFVPR